VHRALFVARRRTGAENFTLIEGSCFAASTAGTTNRADYEFMRDEILAQLKAALPLDGVLLRILVITDNDKPKADRLATEIGQEFVAMRGRTAPDYLSIEAGIDAVEAFNANPVVMADPADNAGGGAPSDNTTNLRRVIERDVPDAAVGPIWDPIAARLCFDAGEGGSFPLRFGGKIGPTSGAPIDAEVTVTALKRDCWQSFGPT
jgi:microcystin degradation protein MlrC